MNFDLVELRQQVMKAVLPAIELAISGGKKVVFREETIFEDGAVEPATVEFLVIPEGITAVKGPRGLNAEVSFAVALRTDNEETMWEAASGLYTVAKRSGVHQLNMSFLAPDDAEEPEYLIDARVSTDL